MGIIFDSIPLSLPKIETMAELGSMPPLSISQKELKWWGQEWLGTTNNIDPQNIRNKAPNSFSRQQSMRFASFVDEAFGNSLATFLGNKPIRIVRSTGLSPEEDDIVEVGPVQVVGGVRPQNFDAAYRPDGPRVVFDSKTLNDADSIRKNWQNMINDLGTEATTVHTRFPYAIVVFIVLIPAPALALKQEHDLILTLERLSTRRSVIDLPHLAECISFITWDPQTGEISNDIPPKDSSLRYETMAETVSGIYRERYKGLPPHNI
ncbi:MAG: hypothetical protein R3B47_16950 [Bacteroidia bacterium]